MISQPPAEIMTHFRKRWPWTTRIRNGYAIIVPLLYFFLLFFSCFPFFVLDLRTFRGNHMRKIVSEPFFPNGGLEYALIHKCLGVKFFFIIFFVWVNNCFGCDEEKNMVNCGCKTNQLTKSPTTQPTIHPTNSSINQSINPSINPLTNPELQTRSRHFFVDCLSMKASRFLVINQVLQVHYGPE